MNDLKAKLENINARMAAACKKVERDPAEVRLLAVSKRHPAPSIRALYQAGQQAFGENTVQEAMAKQIELADLSLEWHFIGPVQSNKTAAIAQNFSWVQSVDREKILRRLSSQRPSHLGRLNICIQVNIDREAQKSGALAEDVEPLARLALALPGLRLRGLMAIPRAADARHDPSASFHATYAIYRELQAAGLPLDTLSMGMSEDLEQAIAAGSTMVRVGTDLFGSRR